MKIFGMGLPELILILAVVLVIFGPKNLPKLGGMLGRTVTHPSGAMSRRTNPRDQPASASTAETKVAANMIDATAKIASRARTPRAARKTPARIPTKETAHASLCRRSDGYTVKNVP